MNGVPLVGTHLSFHRYNGPEKFAPGQRKHQRESVSPLHIFSGDPRYGRWPFRVSRTREPFEPPQSAVIVSSLAFG
jgi:hypothetical protein